MEPMGYAKFPELWMAFRILDPENWLWLWLRFNAMPMYGETEMLISVWIRDENC